MRIIEWEKLSDTDAPSQEFLEQWCHKVTDNIYIFFGQTGTTLFKFDDYDGICYQYTQLK